MLCYLFVWRLRIDEDEESNDESDRDSDCETKDPQHTPEKSHLFSFFFFFLDDLTREAMKTKNEYIW